ncbi:hypothetical protein [uncultured Paracoccus sp.]|uniref:hypothetical protein n=1 Tax=uncultured Paracoccus sp. TaxID=189685 RepID=UPI0025F3639C|nr:hypothetical protein [uncultured Paracoccus sp.]
MTARSTANPCQHDLVVPRHNPQSLRLRKLMDEARMIREQEERGELKPEAALEMLGQLKSRHRTIFQRMLGI